MYSSMASCSGKLFVFISTLTAGEGWRCDVFDIDERSWSLYIYIYIYILCKSIERHLERERHAQSKMTTLRRSRKNPHVSENP